MKNNKVAQAVMLIFVLGVWGIIFYKIYDKISGDDDVVMPSEILNNTIVTGTNLDTFHLLANYNDPFLNKSGLGSGNNDNSARPVTNNVPKQVKQPVANVAAAQTIVKYLGLIKNNASKKKVALISVNGKSSLLQENQSVDNLKLVKVLNDSIEIRLDNKKMFIKK